jgi:hypothetical protein
LVAFVQELYAQGYDAGEVYGLLLHVSLGLRAQGREADEDAVSDIMDRIVGWCAPGRGLHRPAVQRD